MLSLNKLLMGALCMTISIAAEAGPVYNCGDLPASTEPNTEVCQCIHTFSKAVCVEYSMGSCTDQWINYMYTTFGEPKFNQLCKQYPDIIPADKTATDCTNEMVYFKNNCPL